MVLDVKALYEEFRSKNFVESTFNLEIDKVLDLKDN